MLLEPISGLSLTPAFSVFCSIAYLCRFRGGLRCSVERPECVLQHLRPVFPFCASRHTGVGICSPPCSFSLVSISCPTVGCNTLVCYFLAFISTYLSLLRPSASAFICDLCLLGRVPMQSSVLCNRVSLSYLSLLLFGPRPPWSLLLSARKGVATPTA